MYRRNVLLSLLTSRLFFFNDTATTEIYTLSLHDALPIYLNNCSISIRRRERFFKSWSLEIATTDRKSTRLNSSHSQISYAVFCLKKKKVLLTSSPVSPHTEALLTTSSSSPTKPPTPGLTV